MFRAKTSGRGYIDSFEFLFSLVVEEESVALIHLLPAGLAGGCVLDSSFGLDCRLVVEQTTSSAKTDS